MDIELSHMALDLFTNFLIENTPLPHTHTHTLFLYLIYCEASTSLVLRDAVYITLLGCHPSTNCVNMRCFVHRAVLLNLQNVRWLESLFLLNSGR
ncbi:hypothetical protein H5410_025037 [Solanum commersonii]|uniref:Uncharacterized protein n=1 Tax=Solanum commersonii TaxID=4109 RepID=A0A9J5YSP2_SOLCO|nr:hypothetical protein H5410_025037 [Solanum commersonii]